MSITPTATVHLSPEELSKLIIDWAIEHGFEIRADKMVFKIGTQHSGYRDETGSPVFTGVDFPVTLIVKK